MKISRAIELLLFWGFMALLGSLVVSQYHEAKHEERASKASYVQTVCDNARDSADFAQCYAVQDSTGVEYLCNSAKCWTEVK